MTFQPYIQGYYDRPSRTVYLNLSRGFDPGSLLRECREAKKEIQEKVDPDEMDYWTVMILLFRLRAFNGCWPRVPS